jgi:hypothetical protein
MTNISDHVKSWLDYVSISTALTSFVGLLPAVASLMSIIWTGIRIYEWRKNRGNVKLD